MVSGLRLPEAAFWRGRRVFLTGHTGFKGGWLALWLNALGARVRGYALAPETEPNLFGVARLQEQVEHEIADIRDLPALARSVREFRPQVVIHMAAQSLVRRSYAEPVETYAVNVMGTVHVLEAVRQAGGVEATLIVTSDKCYENTERIWGYREDDRLGGHDPYSNSKGCAELVASAYGKSFFGPNPRLGALATVRAGNVIGGGDWATDRLMTDIVRALGAGESPVIRRPQAVRPWQHVLEPLSGYLVAAEHLVAARPSSPQCWNFGPGADSEIAVLAVARRLCEIWGFKPGVRVDADPAAPHEAGLLALDTSKARHELNWRPRWSLDTGLQRTVDWYKRYAAGQDMRMVTLGQIEEYQQPAASNRASGE